MTPEPVPTATPTQEPAQEPTAEPAGEPTAEAAQEPTAEPAGEATDVPVSVPAPVEGSQILVNGTTDALLDEEGNAVLLYQRMEGEALVPFTTLSRLLGWTMTPDEGNPDGYSVAANRYMLHVAYSRDEAGQVILTEFQVDGLPVEVSPELVTMAGEELLLTPAALDALLNAQWSFSEHEPMLILIFPPKETDTSGISG